MYNYYIVVGNVHCCCQSLFRSMITIEEGFETQLCLFFEYFGTSMSAIVLAYITLWKVALILNIVLMLAVLLTVILLKVSI